MYFFSETKLNISGSTVVGSWNVAGYQQLNVQAYAQGGAGSVQLNCYFNNLISYDEKVIISPASSFGLLSRTYAIYAPTLSIVLSNPTGPMQCRVRLYAACCEPRIGLIARLFPPKTIEGDAERKLNQPIDIEALERAGGHVEASN
jgi:hypothetical protein